MTRSSYPPLSCLLAFEATARRKSFALAAGELSVTPSAISHQVAKLEQLLDVRLISRSEREFALTTEGHEYLRQISAALDGISSATDNVRKRGNTLFVHSAPSFAALWLAPKLADFAKASAGISLSLSSSVEHSDFATSNVDIDIRYGRPNYQNLYTELVFEERVLPLASPRFLERNPISEPGDLANVPLIQSVVNVVQWSEWLHTRNVGWSPGAFPFRFDRSAMSLDAAIQGLGVALESESIAMQHIRTRRLRRVFPAEWCVVARAHYLVCPHRHLTRPAVIRFVEWVREHAASTTSINARKLTNERLESVE